MLFRFSAFHDTATASCGSLDRQCRWRLRAVVALLLSLLVSSAEVESSMGTKTKANGSILDDLVDTERHLQLNRQGTTLLDLLKSKPSLETFVRLLEMDNSEKERDSVFQVLWTNNKESATVLAPTNKAFSKFFRRFGDEDSFSPAQVRRLLQYHVLLPVKKGSKFEDPDADPVPSFPLTVDRLRRRADVGDNEEDNEGSSSVRTLLGENSRAVSFFRLTYKVTQEGTSNTTIAFQHGAKRAKLVRRQGKDQRRLSIVVPGMVEQRILVYIVDQVIATPELQTTGKLIRSHPYLKYFRKELSPHMDRRVWKVLDDPQKQSTAFLPYFFRWECFDGKVFVNDTALTAIANYHFGAPAGRGGGVVTLDDVWMAPNRTLLLPTMAKDGELVRMRARKKRRLGRPVLILNNVTDSFPCAGGDRHLKIQNGDVFTQNGIMHFPICNLMPERFDTGSELCY